MNPSKFTPVLAPFSDEVSILEFRTAESWTAYDLGRALSALDSVYSSFVLVRHLGVLANRRLQQSEEQLGRFWTNMEREGPDFKMLMHEWHQILRQYGLEAASMMFPFGTQGVQAGDRLSQVLPSSEVEYYVNNPSEYLPPTHELKIKKIAIASPGGFSLEGLGEPLREVRELIKDLCYRNRQEREKGDLEILKQKLELVAQNNLNPVQIQLIAQAVLSEVEEVREVISDGHLFLDDSNGPMSESNSKDRKPMRRRKRAGKK